MILHGLGEDGFALACAVLFTTWNNLDCFDEDVRELYKHCISTSIGGNLSIPRYNGKEQLRECTINGNWNNNIKKIAIEAIKAMTNVCVIWPDNAKIIETNGMNYEDYHKIAVNSLYNLKAEDVKKLCNQWADDIINSKLINNREMKYIERESMIRGNWA
ncbi:unnamed protein product [Cunninghamella blakesleeana]